MASEPRQASGLKALLIAVPIGLVLAWSLPAYGPSRAELAQALSARDSDEVRPRDLRDLDCRESSGGGYACDWEQREDDTWHARAGRVLASADGWRVLPGR